MTLSMLARLKSAAGLVGVATMAVCLGAVAAATDDKKRVQQARAQADADLAAQEALCRQRFAVTPCLLDAREQHRAIVGPLQRDQFMIDERERQQRAADRLRRLDRKAQTARLAASAAEAASAPLASDSEPLTTKSASPIRHRLRSPASGADAAGVAAVTADTASAPLSEPPSGPSPHARSPKRLTPAPDPSAVQRAEDRVREAEERRARVLARNAERSAKKPPAASLPVPGASAPASSPGLVR